VIVRSDPKAYRFITWSKHDTPETVKQVRRHNAIHDRLAKGQ
jgi:hypothetical protein